MIERWGGSARKQRERQREGVSALSFEILDTAIPENGILILDLSVL